MKSVFTYLVRFSYMQHLWMTAMVSNILGSLAVSPKCPWGDSRLQFLGPSFPWENLSWPLRWLLVPSWGNHRLSLMWLQGALMLTQFSPEVTSGCSWPWVALGWSQITRGDTRGWNFKELQRNKLRLTWGWAEVLSMDGSYCANIEQIGLTWSLLPVSVMYLQRWPTNEGELSSDQ